MTAKHLEIREEQPGDKGAIHTVEEKAFGRWVEADLVDSLRDEGAFILSLVALKQGSIVGHILFSPAVIEGDGKAIDVVALAPMAVLPEHQRSGVGSALVRRGMEMCRDMGHCAIILVGHTNYYPRFGFVPGSSVGIADEFGAGDAFMVAELMPGALNQIKGTAKFRSEFNDV